jgi:hypothetical protein
MKRNIFMLALIFTGNILWGQNSLKNVIINGSLDALERIIEKNELFDLSQKDLRILRNTIFAKYGYTFISPDLQNHFSKFSWYQVKNTNVDIYFSSVDTENISRIQQRENFLQEIIMFQNEIILWIQNERMPPPLNAVNINGICLYQNPVLYQNMPDRLRYDAGDFILTQAFCFATGRFLTSVESERIIKTGNAKELMNTIIFSPSALFLNDPMFSRVYRPFNDTGIFLIVFPRDGSAAYNIQADQILNNSSRNVLILPWSVHYFVYKIANDGKLELVDEVAAN